MHEFEQGGQRYRSAKLNAFEQLHVARRIAPLVTALAPGERSQLERIAEAAARLSNEDSEYVLNTCLAVVERYSADKQVWGKVWSKGLARAMYEDLYDLPALLPLVVEVIKDNLGNFSGGLLTGA